MLAKRVNEYAVVARVNVPYLKGAIEWYEDTFDLKNDEHFYVPDVWAQLNCPGIKHFAVGLSAGPPTPGEDTVTTFVVKDIKAAREDLQCKKIVVEPIQEPGKGVKLAYFYDPFGNKLCLRQNSR